MSFPIGLLLIPYAIVVLMSLVLAVLNVYHLIHYGATTRTSFLFTFIFVAGIAVMSFVSWQVLGGVNWSDGISFSVFGGGPNNLPGL